VGFADTRVSCAFPIAEFGYQSRLTYIKPA
jgi:hypothetical protein